MTLRFEICCRETGKKGTGKFDKDIYIYIIRELCLLQGRWNSPQKGMNIIRRADSHCSGVVVIECD